MLRILLNFSPNASHKGGRFSKALPKKNFEFVPSRRNGTVAFNLGLVLLPKDVDLMSKE